MRMVDADALLENMEMHVTTMSVCATMIEARAKGEMKRTCIADVANAPTIDAIPVEWLKGLMLSTDDDVDKVEFAWIMRKWQKEQEART